jgi:hypothetical protein
VQHISASRASLKSRFYTLSSRRQTKPQTTRQTEQQTLRNIHQGAAAEVRVRSNLRHSEQQTTQERDFKQHWREVEKPPSCNQRPQMCQLQGQHTCRKGHTHTHTQRPQRHSCNTYRHQAQTTRQTEQQMPRNIHQGAVSSKLRTNRAADVNLPRSLHRAIDGSTNGECDSEQHWR